VVLIQYNADRSGTFGGTSASLFMVHTFGFCLSNLLIQTYSKLGKSKLLGIVIAGAFTVQMPFLSPNQQYQST